MAKAKQREEERKKKEEFDREQALFELISEVALLKY